MDELMNIDDIDAVIMSPATLNISRNLSFGQNKAGNDEKDYSANHFVCQICLKMLKEPQECTKCDVSICSDCLETWQKTSTSCPACSDVNARFRPIHRFVKKILMEHRFFCPM